MTGPLAKAGPTQSTDDMRPIDRAFVKECLGPARLRGEIKRWWYQPFKVRLSRIQNWFTVDFFAVMADDTMTAYETKGSWRAPGQDRQHVKIKVAADEYPIYRWVVAMQRRKKDGGGWKFTDYSDPAWDERKRAGRDSRPGPREHDGEGAP